MNEHIKKVWQPGDFAMLCDYQGTAMQEVMVIRPSGSVNAPDTTLVETAQGKRFYVHTAFLAEGPEAK